ncbi:hypothetical protein HU200_028591 [Digitaria exilis]|uniref:F-box domain-containing protein n=1 Tax=Digitaria exilis TaxID=1010633 RepID=A0A835BVH9_9POAL|nr:hypothetical protein HU200_028591 [Digitaria exilis]
MESQRLHPALTADILREIFLRLPSHADLVRACAACVPFCRLVTHPSFLRRYRSLHRPMLLGFIDNNGLNPVPAPHPNAPAARACARTVNFTFGYLPRDGGIKDISDGRILFELIDEDQPSILLWDLAVCYPMSRRCRLVPPVPNQVLASAQIQECDIFGVETFMLPSKKLEEATFTVVRFFLVKTGMVPFVFSSVSGRWSVSTSTSWDALGLDAPKSYTHMLGPRRYMNGCFYWKVNHKDKLLKLDMNTMRFSTHDLPRDHEERRVAIVEAGDGIPKVNVIPHHACFALEIKTFKIVRLNGIGLPAIDAPYSGFPPITSPRSIQGYETVNFFIIFNLYCVLCFSDFSCFCQFVMYTSMTFTSFTSYLPCLYRISKRCLKHRLFNNNIVCWPANGCWVSSYTLKN